MFAMDRYHQVRGQLAHGLIVEVVLEGPVLQPGIQGRQSGILTPGRELVYYLVYSQTLTPGAGTRLAFRERPNGGQHAYHKGICH